MRFRPRLDSNHREIVAVLSAHGASVCSLAGVGGGAPDLLVGWHGWTLLMEVKKLTKSGKVPSNHARTLPRQALWAERWRGGPVYQVESPEAAVAVLMRYSAIA